MIRPSKIKKDKFVGGRVNEEIFKQLLDIYEVESLQQLLDVIADNAIKIDVSTKEDQ